jgi:hypothetical protein
LGEWRLRLRILLRPRSALPVPLRVPRAGFVDFGGIVYASSDEFVAALRRIRPKEVRVMPGFHAPHAGWQRMHVRYATATHIPMIQREETRSNHS